MQFDPVVGVVLGLIVFGLGGYLLYEKREMEKLERIIREKEAILNAPEQPSAAPQ